MLVKLKDGDLEASYMYDLEDEEQTTAALENFFVPRASGLFSVTLEGRSGMANFPIQFHDRLMALTFLGLALNAAHLLVRWWKRMDSQLLMILVNSTMMILLHALIAGLGFSFSLQYEASPDLSLLGMIGKATWLTITPGLYVLILMLCVGIRFGQRQEKTHDKSDS